MNDRARALEMDDEAEVGLVEAHAEGGRGDEHLELVARAVAARAPRARRYRRRPSRHAASMPRDRSNAATRSASRTSACRRCRCRAARAGARPARPAAPPGSGSGDVLQAQALRTSGPRMTLRSSPSCATTSSTTRLFAVAVVASNGMSAGRGWSSARCAGSRGGSRGPSRRCSAPRR